MPRAVGMARQEQVAVVVEVADEGGRHARVEHPLFDFRDRCCRLGKVDGDAHHLGARLGQLDALRGRRRWVGGVGHGHRLNDDGSAASNLDGADTNPDRLVQLDHRHGQADFSIPASGVRRPAFGVRRSAFGVRRSAFGVRVRRSAGQG